jgi:exopolysaccharide biosynthesis predicted pyruvyltransferase EpsI
LNAFRTDRESLGFHKHVSRNRDISIEHDGSGDCQLFFSELAQYEHIRTDRAHVAIASAMLGRRVTFYPGAYHKNQGIYECSLRHFGVAWETKLGEE